MIKHTAFAHETGTTHRVIRGDARSLAFIPDASIHLVITSPPSARLKRADEDDRGLPIVDDYGEFLLGLETVWREVYRVLVPGGRLISIVGDIWLSRKKHGRHRVIPLHADICAACTHIGFD